MEMVFLLVFAIFIVETPNSFRMQNVMNCVCFLYVVNHMSTSNLFFIPRVTDNFGALEQRSGRFNHL